MKTYIHNDKSSVPLPLCLCKHIPKSELLFRLVPFTLSISVIIEKDTGQGQVIEVSLV